MTLEFQDFEQLPEGWRGTAEEILAIPGCPPEDCLWVVLRKEYIDGRTARLFAVWCARQALALLASDPVVPQCIAVLDIVERFANGKATDDELAAAWDMASQAVEKSGWDPAVIPIRNAAWGDPWIAAWKTAEAAVEATVHVATKDTIGLLAWEEASGAAEAATRAAQIEYLRELCWRRS